MHDEKKFKMENLLEMSIKLKRWHAAWLICTHLNSKDYWKKLLENALLNLETDCGTFWSILFSGTSTAEMQNFESLKIICSQN